MLSGPRRAAHRCATIDTNGPLVSLPTHRRRSPRCDIPRHHALQHRPPAWSVTSPCTMTKRAASRAIRLRMLEDALEQAPRSVRELASLFNVGQRTIQRDLEALTDLGHTLEKRGRRYHLAPSSTALNPVEALAVHSATRLLVHHTRVNERHYRSALTKLSRQLPQPARRYLEASVADIETLSSEGSRTLDMVAQAWFDGRVLRFDYAAPIGSGRPHPYELEVYFFEISPINLAPYVIGYERSHFLTLRLDRMAHARLQGALAPLRQASGGAFAHPTSCTNFVAGTSSTRLQGTGSHRFDSGAILAAERANSSLNVQRGTSVADHVTSAKRSQIMARVKPERTSLEMLVRRALHASGLRYRACVKELPGSPDIVLPKYGAVVQIRGCFWHGHSDANCTLSRLPKTNTEFWKLKQQRNAERNSRNDLALTQLGWRVFVVWQCDCRPRSRFDRTIAQLLSAIRA